MDRFRFLPAMGQEGYESAALMVSARPVLDSAGYAAFLPKTAFDSLRRLLSSANQWKLRGTVSPKPFRFKTDPRTAIEQPVADSVEIL